jgi:hypothetical protein
MSLDHTYDHLIGIMQGDQRFSLFSSGDWSFGDWQSDEMESEHPPFPPGYDQDPKYFPGNVQLKVLRLEDKPLDSEEQKFLELLIRLISMFETLDIDSNLGNMLVCKLEKKIALLLEENNSFIFNIFRWMKLSVSDLEVILKDKKKFYNLLENVLRIELLLSKSEDRFRGWVQLLGNKPLLDLFIKDLKLFDTICLWFSVKTDYVYDLEKIFDNLVKYHATIPHFTFLRFANKSMHLRLLEDEKIMETIEKQKGMLFNAKRISDDQIFQNLKKKSRE